MLVKTVRDIGLLVRERRRTLGLSQETLARRAAVSRQWLVALEHGKESVELALVLRVFKALGLKLRLDADGRLESDPPTVLPRPGRRRIDLNSLLESYKGGGG